MQRGFLMLEFSLVLLISAIVGLATWEATRRASDADLANLQADAIGALRAAAHKLVMTNYSAYQAAQPISRNGVTLVDGTTAGQSRNPTVANLRAMDLSVNNAQTSGMYKSLANAGYDVTVERSAACAVNPADPNCHVTGLVCMNQPVRSLSAAAGEIDSFGIGVMLARLGGTGGMSLIGSPGIVYGADGTWSHANPYGAVAGTVCARFGWGTEGDDYLRVSDTRDPNFQGGATVSGTVPGSLYSMVVNGDTNITGKLTLGGTGVPGAACTPDGSMAWGSVGGVSSLLHCVAGVWQVSGIDMASAGATCAPEGKSALTSTGAQLTCRDGAYRQVQDLFGRAGMMSIATYSQGETIPSPTCGTGTIGRLVVLGVVGACTLNAGSSACANDTGGFTGSIGAGNTAQILGNDNTTPAGIAAKLAVAGICSTT